MNIVLVSVKPENSIKKILRLSVKNAIIIFKNIILIKLKIFIYFLCINGLIEMLNCKNQECNCICYLHIWRIYGNDIKCNNCGHIQDKIKE